jgi:hypothetical protein
MRVALKHLEILVLSAAGLCGSVAMAAGANNGRNSRSDGARGSRYCRLHRIASQIARAAILRRKLGVSYVNAIRMKGPILHIFGFTKP